MNADHTHSLSGAVEAAKAGFDSINTEVRVAWRHGLEKGLTGQPNEVVPYKILTSAIEAIKQVVTSRLKLFNGLQ